MLVVPALSLLRGWRPDPEQQRVSAGLRLWALFAGLPAAGALLAWQAARYLPALTGSLAGESTLSLSTGPVTVNFTPSPADFAHAILSPVRWSATSPALIPGAFTWIVLLPASAAGCWLLLRHGTPAARGVIVAGLGYLYLYTCVFQDPGFARQRFTAEVLLLIAALHAFGRHPRRAAMWTVLAASVLVPAELVMAQVIPAKVLVLVVMGAGAAWAAARLARHIRQGPPPGRGAAGLLQR